MDKLHENYKDNTVYLAHEVAAIRFPYIAVIRLKGVTRLMYLCENTPEDLLPHIMDMNLTSEKYIYGRSSSIDTMTDSEVIALYESPIEGLKEKLKIQKLLELPMLEVFNKIET